MEEKKYTVNIEGLGEITASKHVLTEIAIAFMYKRDGRLKAGYKNSAKVAHTTFENLVIAIENIKI